MTQYSRMPVAGGGMSFTVFFRTVAVFFLFLLAGCAGGPFAGLFGEGGNGEEGPPAEDRISILAVNERLSPDPRYLSASVDLPPPYLNRSWPQPGGEADHTLHHIAATLAFERIWTADAGRGSKRAPLTSPPVVVDNRVFVMDTKATVSAIDAADGSTVWKSGLLPDIRERFRLREIFRRAGPEQTGFGGGVAFDGGRIFVTSGFGFVAALDAADGRELWRVQTGAPVRTPPTAYRGLIFLATNTNEFMAIDQLTGQRQWTFSSFEETVRFLSSASAAASGDLVVAPFSSGELVAFLADTGRAVWTRTLARQTRLTALSVLNDIAGSPVIDRGLVFAVSHGGRIAAIDIRSGQPVWETVLAGLQMPWVAGDYLFVVSVDGQLACLSRQEGSVVWVSQLPRFRNEKNRKGLVSWAGPVLAGGNLVLVSGDGELVRVSPQTGEIVQSVRLGGGSVVSPVVAGEVVYILTQKGRLIAMR